MLDAQRAACMPVCVRCVCVMWLSFHVTRCDTRAMLSVSTPHVCRLGMWKPYRFHNIHTQTNTHTYSKHRAYCIVSHERRRLLSPRKLISTRPHHTQKKATTSYVSVFYYIYIYAQGQTTQRNATHNTHTPGPIICNTPFTAQVFRLLLQTFAERNWLVLVTMYALFLGMFCCTCALARAHKINSNCTNNVHHNKLLLVWQVALWSLCHMAYGN